MRRTSRRKCHPPDIPLLKNHCSYYHLSSVKPALILPAILLCLSACKKEEVKSLKQRAADTPREAPATEAARLDEQISQRDAKIQKLARANVDLSKQNLDLTIKRADPAEIALNNARMKENEEALAALEAEQATDVRSRESIRAEKMRALNIPDTVERRRGKIASLDTRIAISKKTLGKLNTSREELAAKGVDAEVLAEAQKDIDKEILDIQSLEQEKQVQQKALQALEEKAGAASSSH